MRREKGRIQYAVNNGGAPAPNYCTEDLKLASD